jgi:hypothetical protein
MLCEDGLHLHCVACPAATLAHKASAKGPTKRAAVRRAADDINAPCFRMTSLLAIGSRFSTCAGTTTGCPSRLRGKLLYLSPSFSQATVRPPCVRIPPVKRSSRPSMPRDTFQETGARRKDAPGSHRAYRHCATVNTWVPVPRGSGGCTGRIEVTIKQAVVGDGGISTNVRDAHHKPDVIARRPCFCTFDACRIIALLHHLAAAFLLHGSNGACSSAVSALSKTPSGSHTRRS